MQGEPIDASDERVEALVRRAVEGDRAAIGELYRIYEARMIAAVHRRRGQTLQGLMESIDLVQSTWGDVLGDLGTYSSRGPGSFEAWLQTCLLNKIRSKGRHHGAERRDAHRVAPLEDERSNRGRTPPAPALDPSPSRIAMGREEIARLSAALERFPPEQRTILVLRMRDGLPYDEIASRVGKSVDATRKVYGRGLQKLIEVLAPRGEGASGSS